MTLGENIRSFRKMHHLTQIELASLAGISVNSLRLYEAEKRTPNIDMVKKIASALKISVTSLLTDDDMIEFLVENGISEITYASGYKYNSAKESIITAFDSLNPAGQEVAVERVEELTEIPKYQKAPPPGTTKDGD